MKKIMSLILSLAMVVTFSISACPTVHAAQTQVDKIIEFAESKLGQAYMIGYCQAFVYQCYKAAGIDKGSASTALLAWEKWGVSTSKDNIPVGACVYFDERVGNSAGHVGIYVGNNQMIHASSSAGKVSKTSMTWYFENCYAGWGWQGGVIPTGAGGTLTIRYDANGAKISSDTYGITSSGLVKTLSDGSTNIQVNSYGEYQKWGLYDFDTFGLYKEGYTFGGWTLESGTKVYDMTTPWYPEEIYPDLKNGSATITAHAVWNPNKLTVSYNANGGTITSDTYGLNDDGAVIRLSSGGVLSHTESYGVREETGFYNNTTFGLYREGYTFLGWMLDDDTTVLDMSTSWCPEEVYPDLINGSASVIAYAAWQKIEHSYEPIVTAPTCTEGGYTTYTCSICGESYVADEVAPIGHSYKSVTTAPTCNAGGFTTHTCSVCGDTYVDSQTAKLEHKLVELTRVEPTSTSDGYIIYECGHGCGYLEKKVLPKVDTSIPAANLVSAEFDSLTINWKAYAGASRYYLVVTNADGFKYSTNTTNTQITIKNLAANTEYSIKIRVGYNNDNSITSYGAIVNFKTAKDDKARLTLANNPDGQSIDVTIVNFVEGETYYIRRVNADGTTTLLATTNKPNCKVKAVAGDNTLYAKAGSTGLNTAKVKIRLNKADVKLVLSAKGGQGYANLTVSSIVEVKNIWYYRLNEDGSSKLVKASSSIYYTADAFRGENTYRAKAEVVYPDGTTGIISSNDVTVNVETPAMTLTCTKEGDKVKIDVASDFEVTNYWIYRIKADGKSELLEATTNSTTYLPASWGTTFKVKVCVIIGGKEMYLGSQNVTVS